MLNVLGVVRHVLWNDATFDRSLLPPEASLGRHQVTLTDLATMTGQERISVFKECDIHSSLHPIFLRALQYLTAVHGAGGIDDRYMIHHLSARQWSPFTQCFSLLGQCSTNSTPFKIEDDAHIAYRKTKTSSSNNGKKQMTKYNGLRNQGATCYLNSLLQALFHISEFRLTIYQMPTVEEAEEKSDVSVKTTKSIPYALQRLFCLLQTLYKAGDTTELTESFGWSSNDGFIQHDVHELTCELLDNLECKLGGSRNTDKMLTLEQIKVNAISRMFVGILENFINVDEAGYCGSNEQPFYDLQLVVKDTTNIYASLDKFFEVEVLDGNNKYCLEYDGKKTYHRAERGVRLKVTPPIMLLHLTRFDYDIEKGETKVLSRWDYYNTLDLSKYMPHASKAEVHYTLFSVFVHSGSDTGYGHYFCFLRCSGTWYRFNDEAVTQASLRDVFGANFGGSRTNYWGSEVSSTTNAYMLIYIRTSEMDQLLRPVGKKDVPAHVVKQLELEQKEHERCLKELADEHLYGRIHFVEPRDIHDQNEFLFVPRPSNVQFTSQRTLRALLSSEALPAFQLFVKDRFGIPAAEQLLWFTAPRGTRGRARLYRRVTEGMTVSSVLSEKNECCVLVISPSNAQHIDIGGDDELDYDLLHHKVYIPMQLKVVFVGCTVVSRRKSITLEDVVEQAKPYIQSIIPTIPDEAEKTRNHHLTKPCRRPGEDSTKISSPYESSLIVHTQPSWEIGKDRRNLKVFLEEDHNIFSPCREGVSSGDILVWQEEVLEEEADNIFYPDAISFQHFLRHRVPIEIKLNLAPLYPTLVSTQLADDMTYEQLQRYVARLIGEPAAYDHIRFTMYSPTTKQPYFMKVKKRDRPVLAKLLSPSVPRRVSLSSYLYYEYCRYTVSEIESGNSLQFKLFSSRVKPLSDHWILIPNDVQITPRELFSRCMREVQGTRAADIASLAGTLNATRTEAEKESRQMERQSELDYYSDLVPEDAWLKLRLVDVWRGRIYNVFDMDHPMISGRSTFEESAEYRIELLPQPLDGVPLESQSLIQVHHFTIIRNKENTVETHGHPFSIYVQHDELPPALLRRIASKLGLSDAAVVDWKLALVQENRVLRVSPTMEMGQQLFQFCNERHYRPNQSHPLKMAFLGLEHAPSSMNTSKREDKVVILK
ncbi:putative Ubiquitin carboxyl terminal hydrolase Ubiquitin specific protease C terminal [Trypanosoma vivax]|nr:putative Ubiquitin carboxyl terminal hydrolase Ubiquitin specific protease C terminal [Trypanosoma vivax]